MSYYCEISFKTLKAEEIYPFFQNLKAATSDFLEEIANDNAFYCPSQRHTSYDEVPKLIANELNRNWAYRTFTFRYFYLPEYNLLGVFGVYDCLRHLFDCTVEFQNSCDRDYEYDTWKGIPLFKEIAEKWKYAPCETVEEQYNKESGDNFREEYCGYAPEALVEKYDYWKRTFAYDEIWGLFSTYLFDDSKALNISLFAGYEIVDMGNFVRFCMASAEETLAMYTKKKPAKD